jgi:murein DD-endopeptidase MepM/ murein hydrolase activator NlpD
MDNTMKINTQFTVICICLLGFFSFNLYAVDHDKHNVAIELQADTANIYQTLLMDDTDDLMENHPADDIYNQIWTSAKLNPYQTSIDDLNDSIQIDLSSYTAPLAKFVRITSHFGTRRFRFHYGVDLKLQVGDTIYASFSGKVRIIDYERRGYGHYVVLRHNNGLETVYAHLSRVLVSHDQIVCSGTPIALGGNTGRSTGPHLHYEIRYLGNAINPVKLIDFASGTPLEEDYLMTKAISFSHQKELKALAAALFYKVRKGDNLSVIARRYGTTVGAICRLNNISPKRIIRIGQTLRVR